MSSNASNLLDEALGIGSGRTIARRVVLVEDCVETSGAFVLHHLMKRVLSPESRGTLLLLALSHPFSHYDRILRKMGCNLSAQRESNRLHFLDMLKLEFPGQIDGETKEVGFWGLFSKLQTAIEVIGARGNNAGGITIMIDDISMLEIAAHGCLDQTLDFLHYCITFTSEHGCGLVILSHGDIYSSEEATGLLSSLEYLADTVVKTEPLATGLAADVHGQLTVLNRGSSQGQGDSMNKFRNFHFKLKENGAEYFYPGSRKT
ncbi:putative elongator complex protein [Dioscorea sansibarensis]